MKIHTDTRGTRSRRGDRCTALLCNAYASGTRARAQRAALVAGQNKKTLNGPSQPAPLPRAQCKTRKREPRAKKQRSNQASDSAFSHKTHEDATYTVYRVPHLSPCASETRECVSPVSRPVCPTYAVRTLSLERDALRAVDDPLSSAQQAAQTPTQLAASPSPAAQRPQLPAAHACDEDGEEPLQRLLGHAHLARLKPRVRVRARDAPG